MPSDIRLNGSSYIFPVELYLLILLILFRGYEDYEDLLPFSLESFIFIFFLFNDERY